MIGRDRWVRIPEAATGVGVSQSTVRRYIRDGAVDLRLGLVRFGAVQDAEGAARRRREAGRKAGGARGAWLSDKADAFFGARAATAADRDIIAEFIAFARA